MTKKPDSNVMNRLILNATDNSGNPIPIIGNAMAWSYSKSEYDQDKVIEAFRVNHLDTDHITKGAERLDAVKRAIKKAKDKGLLREIMPGRYQLTEEILNENASTFEYSLKEVIIYDEANTRFLFEDANGHQNTDPVRSDALMARVAHQELIFANNDITRYTKMLFKNKGIVSLRSSGGLYFIPAKFNELVNNVRCAFNMIDPSGMFMLIEIPDTTNACQSVGASATDMFKEKVAKMKADIAKHKEERAAKIADGTMKKGKNEGPVTNKKCKTQLEDIASLAGDVELLAECLGFELDDAKQALDEYQVELLKELGCNSEEEFQSKQKPEPKKKEKKPDVFNPIPGEVSNGDDLELGDVSPDEKPVEEKKVDNKQGMLFFGV